MNAMGEDMRNKKVFSVSQKLSRDTISNTKEELEYNKGEVISIGKSGDIFTTVVKMNIDDKLTLTSSRVGELEVGTTGSLWYIYNEVMTEDDKFLSGEMSFM